MRRPLVVILRVSRPAVRKIDYFDCCLRGADVKNRPPPNSFGGGS
jgi:hypothetical protein